MEKILITGGAGVIGSHLADRLIDLGNDVVVVDNLSTGKIANIEQLLDNKRFRFVNASILNEDLMDELISQANMVYHLAAAVGVKHIVDDPLQGILINIRGTEIVLAKAYKYWKRVLLASTSEIYGRSEKVPFTEDSERILGPTHIDRWSYSTSKATDEHLAFAYHEKGLPMSIVRYFNSYGPRIDQKGYGSVIANFINQAMKGEPITVYGTGKQTRCFTYVDDTVEGTILAGTRKEAVGEAFNIGKGGEITIHEVAEKIKKAMNSDAEVTVTPYESAYGGGFEDTPRRVPDISKAQRLLGFQPKVEFDEGLQRTIDWAVCHYSR